MAAEKDASMDPEERGDDHEKPLFREISASEAESAEVSVIESLCMNCEKMGTTRILLTKIPLFREVIVMAFHCPHCNASNNEIQSGASVQDEGVRYTLQVEEAEYLNRLVVKGDQATVRIPELQFEIPPNTQKGCITTVESIIRTSVSELDHGQLVRRTTHPELAARLDEFITKLTECLEMKRPFTLVVDDPSGNSYVENKCAPDQDPHLSVEHYRRTEGQDRELGALPTSTAETHNGGPTEGEVSHEGQEEHREEVASEEVMEFKTNCSNCQSPSETRMKLVDIPHFKQVIIMATSCEYCGHRSNEVKSGTGVSDKGTKIRLKLTHPSDLNRDILKAETASVSIPELDFEVQSATLGGRFTTIEGLLQQVGDQLKESNPFAVGDSSHNAKLNQFLEKLAEVTEGKRMGVHMVLDDPAGNSYIQNIYAPDKDPHLEVTDYDRTPEQNDELGLTDMKTENYEDLSA